MVKWLDCRNWEEAFIKVIPERKLKDSELINQNESEDEEQHLPEKQESDGDAQ
jgi:tRNA (guanine9-N1)-methyltransferase